MSVPSKATERDTADPQIRVLRFDVIRRRAAEKLGIEVKDVKRYHLAELFGLSLKSISRFRGRRMEPALDTALRISEVLELPVEEIMELAPRAVTR